MKPFIYPIQYNQIRRELKHLLSVVYFAGDYRVYKTAKEQAQHHILDLFDALSPDEQQVFDGIEEIAGQKELGEWLEKLRPFTIPFPSMTREKLRKLFKKEKKLVLPDLDSVNFANLTYLGWRDTANQTIYLVYPFAGEMMGLKGRYAAGFTTRNGICAFCNAPFGGGEIGLVTVRTKRSEYQTAGNYICLDSEECNARLTSTELLDTFFARALAR